MSKGFFKGWSRALSQSSLPDIFTKETLETLKSTFVFSRYLNTKPRDVEIVPGESLYIRTPAAYKISQSRRA